MQFSKLASIGITGIILISCTGNNNTLHSSNNQHLKAKLASNVDILTIDGLDNFSKSCYSTVHYYDPKQKISLSIADNGVVGGAIMGLEHLTDSQNQCNMHLYTWNTQFTSLQYAPMDTDCSNRTECYLANVKYSDNNLFGGIIAAPAHEVTYFVSDGNNFELETASYYYMSPNLSYGIKRQEDVNYAQLLGFDRLNQTETKLKNWEGTFMFPEMNINDDKIVLTILGTYSSSKSLVYDVKNNQEHIYDKNINQYPIKLKTISNDSNYLYGEAYENFNIGDTIIKQIKAIVRIYPKNNYNYQEISDFPFNKDNVELSSIKAVNDGALLLLYKKYRLDETSKVNVDSKYMLYSSLNGQFYQFRDLMAYLGIDSYISQISSIQMSENGNYMLLTLSDNGKSNNIAIRIKFDGGINQFITTNLQPM